MLFSHISDTHLGLVQYSSEERAQDVYDVFNQAIDTSIKDHVNFEKNFDLIVCRNVLIYFNRELQPLLFEKFFKALRPGGYLVLGRTESLPLNFRKKFQTINTTHRVFKKID